ncbi:hypothetical protein CLHOM_13320 [Clostridium homopropionicum DSM 5847]|uniref:Uncharacterized protein n=1 Tax=Clostridium homopropionicum DSM 5847 TaxID=1121318 RepID=A0A0L6ZB00_9CLOT|nr:hypothetical protein [Clostridium homopropionicum]KOA20137.1 hypothetical protein CLHOM_13320 [Clostridium homopropionicum DSM 5847]SFG61685.1 hypothetical protein SAMN04488501_111143 [Clostridium homopropionicum]
MIEDILKTEYSLKFDDLRKNRMITSYYKYGPIKNNYGEKLINAIENLEIRLKKYKDTGNTEYLLDVANFAMIEFMYPQHKDSFFKATDSEDKLEGMTIKELENL